MGYKGSVELKASEIKRKTVTGSTSATHVLTWTAPSEQALIVTINGVKQHDSAYTISGTPTTVTLDAALVSTDELEVIGINDVGQTITPAEGSVTNAHIDGGAAIATSKISGLAASATTDTTSATNISSGTLATARLGSTIDLSGATVTLPVASVTSHVTAFDDNNIKNDIALLGFKIATNHSLTQYTLDDQIINEFASSTDGIDAANSTNEAYSSGHWFGGVAGFGGDDANTVFLIHGDESVAGGTISNIQGTNFGTAINGTWNGSQSDFSTNRAKWGSKSMYFDGTGDYVTVPSAGHMNFVSSKPFTIDMWLFQENTNEENFTYGVNGANNLSLNVNSDTGGEPSGRFEFAWSWAAGSRNHNTASAGDGGFTTSTWHHCMFSWNGSNSSKVWVDGALVQENTSATQGPEQLAWNIGWSWTGNIDEYRLSNVDRPADSGDPCYSANGTTYTVPTEAYSDTTAGSDLTLQSTATTASSAPTKGDLIMLYTDQAGTATLDTDLKGWISRDGTNFTEVDLVSEGTYGSQKIAVAHDVTLTSASGTSMKWKITTHNQSAGSKETHIHAISLGWS